MKQVLIIISLLLSIISDSIAQTETKSFNVDGIKVIYKPSVKDIINIRIYYRGGTSNYPVNMAGIESVTLAAAAKCGTKKYSSEAIRDSSDKYDILMYGNSNYDYGYIQVNCVARYFDQAWDIFTEAVVNPTFEPEELELLKKKKTSDLKIELSSPYMELRKLQMENAFVNTTYAINPEGNAITLGRFSSNDLKNYYNGLLNKNKIFIVAVGKVTQQELVEKIIASFGNMPSRSSYSAPDNNTPVWNDSKLITENRELSTNYISAIMNSPGMTNVEYIPFLLGMSGLSGNINATLKNELHLSYSQGTNTFALRMPFAEMYASTTNPQDAMKVMLDKLKSVQHFEMNDEWLERIKNGFITGSYIDDQSASSITSRLGEAEVLGGWQYAEDLPKLVMMATSDQVNRALQNYVLGIRWYYLGKTDAIEGFKPPVY